MAAQTAGQARARDLVDELAGHRQQVIQGQQEGLTQRCHHPTTASWAALSVAWSRWGAVRGIFHPVGDCYTQSVMMSDLSNAVAPRFDFLRAPFNSLFGQQA